VPALGTLCKIKGNSKETGNPFAPLDIIAVEG
jgi:hypothetical protein